ncbi:RHS repeat domain-containing protein [Amaricoccus sp.]|uniref:RHS repeat domain-containing protein n=1 Tax=Amaricoccus sp. TaxID=1872485 RepID=UPI001B545B48|nr:RHS repeat-associated core domain-containing protein [Amaricoccus sp.]MBP7002077.1 RHS repeat-associated core domain-containing protein [Amaricoccus sp.]
MKALDRGLGGRTMTYDAENRVTSAMLGGVTTSYAYGADGTRRKRRTDGVTTLTIGPIEVRNYRVAGEALLRYPTPWFRLHGGSLATFHRDQVGSIQLISDAAGQQGRVTTYQPFGEARDVDVNPLAQPETQGYVGERFDAGPELQFLNARYYDPKLSLFTSPDWLEVTDPGVGTNRYAYAGNSPVNNADPGGNCPSCIGAAIGALAGGIAQGLSDLTNGRLSSLQEYGASIGTGALIGATFGIAGPEALGARIAIGAASGELGSLTHSAARGNGMPSPLISSWVSSVVEFWGPSFRHLLRGPLT